MNITFYSTHCPKCKVIETKLKRAALEYTEINDVAVMLQLGFKVAPVLVVDDKTMDFTVANKFLTEVIKSNGGN